MKLIERLERQINTLQEVQSKLLHHESLGELEDWIDREFPTSSLDIDMQSMTINLSGTKADLERIWAGLRQRGWFLPAANSRPKDGEPSWCGFFRKEKDEDLDDPQLVFLMFCSTICRRVKIGERTVTEDIFETRCGDTPAETKVFDPPPSYSGDSQGSVFDLPSALPPLSEIVSIALPAPVADTPEAAPFDDDIPF